ncbi:RNA-directed DNA polymerase, eukaryota [Tanacetum coccineum]
MESQSETTQMVSALKLPVLKTGELYGPNIDSHSIHYSSNWCSILKEMQMLKAKGFDFLSLCNKRVGDGNNTSFWLDTWRGDSALCDSFPRMFALEMEKNCMVATKMAAPVDASFRRSVRGGIELVQFNELRAILESVSLSHSLDRWICNASSDGSFRVKDIRNLIDDLILPSGSGPTKWMKYVPIKINIFVWRARRDCLPTRVNLMRRGVVMESTDCPICGLVEEDAHHILLQCDLAHSVLRRICRWWDIDWQSWSSFHTWDGWFSSIKIAPNNKKILEGPETVKHMLQPHVGGKIYAGNSAIMQPVKFLHIDGPCPQKCQRCQRIGHMEKDCRVRLQGAGNQQNDGARGRAYVIELAYHRALIDCYEKIVRIPLPNGKILEVQGERPEKDLGSLACIKPDEKKLDDIRASPVVRSPYRLALSEMISSVESLRGRYTEDHIKMSSMNTITNLSKIAKPLTLLTQKNKAYVWGDKQDEAFQILKEKLCNAPVLALPDGPDDFVVYCDASKQGFGSVLMQQGKVIAYASRQLKKHEKKLYHP